MTALPGRLQRPGQPERPGRPLHPPLTDFPIAAYVFAAIFDVISAAGGDRHSWARQFWHAGTFVLIAGASICVLTVLTGFRDLLKLPDPGSGAVRSIGIHVCVMVAVFMVGVGDIAWRLKEYASASTPAGILVLSLVAAAGVGVGAAYGGALVFRHGAGVAIAGAGAGAIARPGAGVAGAEAGVAGAEAGVAGAEARSGAAGAEPRSAGQVTAQSAAASDMAWPAARHRLRRGK
jgi:uncharacterized membrane protein